MQKPHPYVIPNANPGSYYIQFEQGKQFYGLLHTHPELQLTFIQAGTGTIVAGGHMGTYKPGDVFLIGSNVPHLFNSASTSEYSKAVMIFLNESMIKNPIFQEDQRQELGRLFELAEQGTHFSADPSITQQMQLLSFTKGLEQMAVLLKLFRKVNEKQHNVLENMRPGKKLTDLDGNRLKEIFDFTFREFGRPITLKEVADMASMTVPSFCRFFKKKTQKSYVTFLNQVRINHAALKLGTTGKSILELAYDSGFQNLSHFNRQFKKHKKLTPQEYRKGR